LVSLSLSAYFFARASLAFFQIISSLLFYVFSKSTTFPYNNLILFSSFKIYNFIDLPSFVYSIYEKVISCISSLAYLTKKSPSSSGFPSRYAISAPITPPKH